MVIFIMMLVSTALMYYYFQRTRYLERELTALRNGEEVPRSKLLSVLPWTKDDTPAPVTTPAPEIPSAESQPQYVAPTTPASSEPEVQESTASSAGIQEHSALDSLDMTDSEEDSDASTAEDQANDTLTPEQETAMEESDEPESTEPAEATQPIESLYDQMPPPVRVRSPRRD